MNPATTDLCDAHPEVQACEPVFGDYGGKLAFHGPAKTLKVFEDNALVRTMLEQPGDSRVLVVDGGGSMRCALLGDQLGALAVKNGWAGVLVYGCIRDADAIGEMNLGVKALGTHPRKSEKGLHTGREDAVLAFAGVTVRTGAWIYADSDGVVVAERAIHR
jgi:regulator of ribonuclease activity A